VLTWTFAHLDLLFYGVLFGLIQTLIVLNVKMAEIIMAPKCTNGDTTNRLAPQ
jgi:hypothetical protein